MRYDLLNLDIPSWINLRSGPKSEELQEQINHSLTGYDEAWKSIIEAGCIELPPDDGGSRERLVWPLDEEITVDRDALRDVLANAVMQSQQRIKNETAFGMWLVKKCGGGVSNGADRDAGIYRLPPRGDAAKRAGSS